MELSLNPCDEPSLTFLECIGHDGQQQSAPDFAEFAHVFDSYTSEKSDDSFPEDEMGQVATQDTTVEAQKPQKSQKRRQPRLLLWQFMLLQLLQGHSCLAWIEDQWSRPGVFKFTDTNEAARLWGGHKGNRNMSYEKMSRCIRDYYTRRANKYFGVMLPDGRGKDHRRVHFAFNLQNPAVLKYIKTHRADYYWSLVTREIVRHH